MASANTQSANEPARTSFKSTQIAYPSLAEDLAYSGGLKDDIDGARLPAVLAARVDFNLVPRPSYNGVPIRGPGNNSLRMRLIKTARYA